MHQKGHLGVTLLTWAPIVAVIGVFFDYLILYALVGTFLLVNPLMPLALLMNQRFGVFRGRYSLSLCMIPDVDMKLPLVKHRGFTHTVWFAAIFAVLSGVIGYGVLSVLSPAFIQLSQQMTIAIVVFSGYIGFHAVVSHILADALTPMGIRPFAPLSKREFGLGLMTAGNTIGNLLLLLFGILAVVLAFYLPQAEIIN
ncbi:MAG: metal-dependent hydrolase [Halobacteriaceae archaeon]